MANMEKRDITRVNMNLPTPMVERVREYANELGLPITHAYTVLLSQALQQKDTLNELPKLLETIEYAKEMQEKEEKKKEIE